VVFSNEISHLNFIDMDNYIVYQHDGAGSYTKHRVCAESQWHAIEIIYSVVLKCQVNRNLLAAIPEVKPRKIRRATC
jgi:hypothetical protein